MARYDAYTKSLLHMNGADAATVFTDEIGKIWTPGGDAQIDTAQSKFGGASGLLDGTGDWIDTPDHDDFNVGSGDFTLDFWVYRSGGIYMFGQADSAVTAASASMGGWSVDGTTFAAVIVTGTTAYTATVNTSFTAGFHHLAFIRHGNNLYTAFNGTLSAPVNVTGVTVNNSTYKFSVGRYGEHASSPFSGWIDEFRFSKGIARWTANFTPPIREYMPISGLFTFHG